MLDQRPIISHYQVQQSFQLSLVRQKTSSDDELQLRIANHRAGVLHDGIMEDQKAINTKYRLAPQNATPPHFQ